MSDDAETTVVPATAGNGVNFDPNHPYFLYSSDSPGMSLVNAVFDGRGFQGWRRSVLIALSAKNKMGFINGSYPAPAATSKDHQPWSRLEKSQEDEMLIQFLMGLNESYGQARGNILMMNPLPNINHAYSLILQDENQREIYANPLISSDSSAFMVGSQGSFSNQKSFSQRNGKQRVATQFQRSQNGFQRSGNQSPKPPTTKAKKSKFNPNVTCSYCKKTRHLMTDCYRIIGFPENFEFTNGKIGQGPIRSNRAFSEEQGGDANNKYNDALEHYLSKDQFSQLIQLIKQVKVSDSGSSNSEVNANAVVGTIVKYSGSCFLVFNASTWIIDSGASEHMCFDSNAFISLTPLPVPLQINLTDSYRITVTHIGKISILPNYVVEKVLYASLMKSAQVFGEAREGLYLLEPTAINSRNSAKESVATPFNHSDSVQFSAPFPFSANAISDVNLWHIRLGGTWTFLISTKSNAFGLLKNFLVMVERQFGVKVQKLRTDNAFELGRGSQESAFLASQGVLHQTSCVSTPQQNGIVERKHKHLLEITKALLFQSYIPIAYWGECVLTSTYLINRLPSKVLKGKTPLSVLFNQPTSYDQLKSFGCLCYVSTLSNGRSKFDPRAKACVFLGYPLGQKGYKLLELDTRKIIVSRDVHFVEDKYPFVSNSVPSFPDSIFPIPSQMDTAYPTSPPVSPSLNTHSPIPSSEQPPHDSNSPSPNSSTQNFPSSVTPVNSQSPQIVHSSGSNPSCSPHSPRINSHEHVLTPPAPRRSARETQWPSHFKDFICNNIFLTQFTDSCLTQPTKPNVYSFRALSAHHQVHFRNTRAC
ncbi:PREDICTED: uncharacterized protein LOC109220718 [Nicotiana attenuata]|uniref:uncharacterized protein LOC109220718 n=1 Tax=Nicotiana attenuata TaxID=49451 RepID=UPI0009054E80|nr:PREDICTED: uncharacterized protein LOC109220718 [Nicotiana attenuata]